MVTIWSFARIIAPVVTTTSIILSSNKIQNGDVLILANPDPSGNWPLKWRERVGRERVHVMANIICKAVYFFHAVNNSYAVDYCPNEPCGQDVTAYDLLACVSSK